MILKRETRKTYENHDLAQLGHSHYPSHRSLYIVPRRPILKQLSGHFFSDTWRKKDEKINGSDFDGFIRVRKL